MQYLPAFYFLSHLAAPNFSPWASIYDCYRTQLHGSNLSAGPLALGDVCRLSALYRCDDYSPVGDSYYGDVHGILRQFHHRKGLDGAPLDRRLYGSGISALAEKYPGP